MKRVNVGVIGLGMGSAHLKCYEACPQAKVVALCDVDEAKLNSILKDRPGVEGFTDYRKMLKMKELHAVSVALPNYLHAPVTIAALQAGKHVLCEKPMAMNAREAQQMKRAAERAHRILMMHFNMRFFAPAATLKPIIEAGTLGDIYHVTTTYLRRDGYPKPGGWFGQKDKSGGGPLIDLGVHRIDFAMWLIGYPRPVAALGAVYNMMAREKLKGLDFDCEDFSAAMIRFANGCTMYVAASWDGYPQPGRGLTMEIFGTKGAIYEKANELVLCKKENGIPVACTLEQRQPKETAQQHFVDCIIRRKKPGPSADNGVTVMKILDAIYESARTGTEVLIR
jgi:predicted dehydrogenase